ncbi:hypothetical protein SK128_023284 [Halocaridina rubra]|uniref:Synaptic plasticity regulator PANTS n=1 Tax=Halocaridina rubra TaxID=373956 RepID=A0AAN9A9P5_HALRR
MESEVPFEQLDSLPKWSWLVKPCERYKEELSECRSIKRKFHQYYIHGETKDCSQWKADYKNCLDYRKNKNIDALSSVIDSEKVRCRERLSGHYKNTVWEKRESPPDDWSSPLPEENLHKDDISFLAMKAKELKEGKVQEEWTSICTIS